MVQLLDPNEQERQYKKFDNGDYATKAIKVFSLDSDSGLPILVADKNGNMVCRFRFILLSDEDGPPMQLELGEMSMLAQAFGVNDKLGKVPDLSEAGLVSQYLKQIETLIYNASKVVTVKVYNGWVSDVPGMTVPEGKYYAMMTNITTKKDGVVSYGEGKNGNKFVYVEFTILAGQGGSETPYKGATFTEGLNYPFKLIDDEIQFKKDDDGNWSNDSLRMSKVIRLTAPTLTGDLVPVNGDNICPHWLNEAKKSKQVLEIERKKSAKSGKIHMSWYDIEPVYNFETPKKSSVSLIPEELSNDAKARKLFTQAMDIIVGKKSVNSDGSPTEDAKQVLGPIIGELRQKGTVTSSKLQEFTTEEIKSILAKINDDRLNDIKQQVKMLDFANEEVLINTNTTNTTKEEVTYNVF